MNEWTILQDSLLLLLGAMLLGALFERFKQNAVLGYLLAGALLGPHAFDVLPNRDAILSIAELGVTLLLFAIGMEFSWRKLRHIGSIALGGGTLSRRWGLRPGSAESSAWICGKRSPSGQRWR